ncbi:hypothetical protein KPL71_023720 [Citrus sinensis]|uniref:Uncharacterized protein n=1 Tax=Citrus sinensis TaxID=2711 RepID=A0ACB8IL30_CITSI|nr:hypothetical protein KPL71_023720 [Citrus sinensis]
MDHGIDRKSILLYHQQIKVPYGLYGEKLLGQRFPLYSSYVIFPLGYTRGYKAELAQIESEKQRPTLFTTSPPIPSIGPTYHPFASMLSPIKQYDPSKLFGMTHTLFRDNPLPPPPKPKPKPRPQPRPAPLHPSSLTIPGQPSPTSAPTSPPAPLLVPTQSKDKEPMHQFTAHTVDHSSPTDNQTFDSNPAVSDSPTETDTESSVSTSDSEKSYADITKILMAQPDQPTQGQTSHTEPYVDIPSEVEDEMHESSATNHPPPAQTNPSSQKSSNGPWFTFDDLPSHKWRDRLNEMSTWIDLQMLRPGATTQSVLREFATRFTEVSSALAVLHDQFLGDPSAVFEAARRDYLNMKCCSLNAKDLDFHYKRMSLLFYKLNGFNEPTLKHVFLASLPDELQPNIQRQLTASNLSLDNISLGKIFQLAKTCLDKLCEQKQFFKELLKDKEPFRSACKKPYLQIKCHKKKDCDCSLKKKRHFRKFKTPEFSSKPRRSRKPYRFFRKKSSSSREFKRKQSSRCFICKRKGHYAKDCPNKREKSIRLVEHLQATTDYSPAKDELEFYFSEQDEPNDETVFALQSSSDSDSDQSQVIFHQQLLSLDTTVPIPSIKLQILPSKFQRPIPAIGLIDTGSHDDHRQLLTQFYDLIQSHGIMLSAKKSIIATDNVEFLGLALDPTRETTEDVLWYVWCLTVLYATKLILPISPTLEHLLNPDNATSLTWTLLEWFSPIPWWRKKLQQLSEIYNLQRMPTPEAQMFTSVFIIHRPYFQHPDTNLFWTQDQVYEWFTAPHIAVIENDIQDVLHNYLCQLNHQPPPLKDISHTSLGPQHDLLMIPTPSAISKPKSTGIIIKEEKPDYTDFLFQDSQDPWDAFLPLSQHLHQFPQPTMDEPGPSEPGPSTQSSKRPAQPSKVDKATQTSPQYTPKCTPRDYSCPYPPCRGPHYFRRRESFSFMASTSSSNPSTPVTLSSTLSLPKSCTSHTANKIEHLVEYSYIPESTQISESSYPLLSPYHLYKRPSSFTRSIRTLISTRRPHPKEYIQSSRLDQCSLQATPAEQYVTLEIPSELISNWKREGYTHLHLGGIRLILTLHGRKGLPVTARIAMLDTRFKQYQDAVIGTVLTTLHAGSVLLTFYPNFNLSLQDPNLSTTLKVQVQIQGAEQISSAKTATLHHQLVYRLQNHALDLPTPEHHSDTLMVLAESDQIPTIIQIPRQIPRHELIKLMPLEWISNYEQFHNNTAPIQTSESMFERRQDGTVRMTFKPSPSAPQEPPRLSFTYSSMITAVQTVQEDLPIVFGRSSELNPVMGRSAHCVWHF